MTRRGFCRLLGLAAVTAPATAALVPEKLAAVRAWWVPTGEWWCKEFDGARFLGVAGAFRNVLTGERVRHAVRIMLPQPFTTREYAAAERTGQRLLLTWGQRLPAWRVPPRV